MEVSNAQQPYSIRVGRLDGRTYPDGTDPSIGAHTSEIGVAEDTVVTYCFGVTNTGLTPLAFHDLEDSELGALLTAFNFVLEPGPACLLRRRPLSPSQPPTALPGPLTTPDPAP